MIQRDVAGSNLGIAASCRDADESALRWSRDLVELALRFRRHIIENGCGHQGNKHSICCHVIHVRGWPGNLIEIEIVNQVSTGGKMAGSFGVAMNVR